MKAIYIVLVAIALAFVVFDIIMQTIDFYTFLMTALVLVITAVVAYAEKRHES